MNIDMTNEYLNHLHKVVELFAKTLEENIGGIVEDEFLRCVETYGQVSILTVVDGLRYLYTYNGLSVPECLKDTFYKDAYFWIDEKSLQTVIHAKKKTCMPKYGYILLKEV